MARNKVLIVDDEKDILDLLEYNLEKEGYEVLSAMDGEEAISMAKTEKPNMVLLDIMMPVVDGVDLLELLKTLDLTKNVPVVLLSAKADDADLDRLLNLGARGLIEKGVSAQDLREQVAYALANPL